MQKHTPHAQIPAVHINLSTTLVFFSPHPRQMNRRPTAWSVWFRYPPVLHATISSLFINQPEVNEAWMRGVGRAPPFKMHYPCGGPPARLRLTDRESTSVRGEMPRFRLADESEPVQTVGSLTPKQPLWKLQVWHNEGRGHYHGDLFLTAARTCLKTLTREISVNFPAPVRQVREP